MPRFARYRHRCRAVSAAYRRVGERAVERKSGASAKDATEGKLGLWLSLEREVATGISHLELN
jgi:hypothetical protein